MASISFRNLIKRYGHGPSANQVLHGVNAEIQDGEFVVIVGPSGCGKSTLLRMVAGLEEISDGQLLIGDKVVNDVEPAKRDIAMVFQNYALYPHMSNYENMAYGLKIAKVPPEEIKRRVDKAAKILELSHLLDRKPRQLSGGQRQRVAIARVMLKDAPILLLDEATSALDSEVEAAIQQSLDSLMHGKTVIAIAHRLSTIAAMDRLIVMDQGQIVEQGTHQQLLELGGIYAKLWSHQSGGFLAEQGSEAANANG